MAAQEKSDFALGQKITSKKQPRVKQITMQTSGPVRESYDTSPTDSNIICSVPTENGRGWPWPGGFEQLRAELQGKRPRGIGLMEVWRTRRVSYC
ncbi:hypothetical protein GCM10007857_63320 [Bradyrhizobium iriomotense]|uniref:Uncharacterized protein n=1 Tax=Bradyrhizobium iriomotense TaxID=441950 RepID=A0ABQ6BBS0_9BRAD|nr:hypothetical protein GCM10007857_63320 [Bradyrhizobium iriomotense]